MSTQPQPGPESTQTGPEENTNQGIWARLYDWTLNLAGHKHAERWLAGVSLAESSFFPIPVDIMLAPMVMAERAKAWRFAAVTTVFSVLGGIIGYFIGLYLLEAITPILHKLGYWDSYQTAVGWFAEWGFITVFIAGFTPIPYKVFTIAAGASAMALLPFVIASLVGRSGRFFLVAGLVYAFGQKIEDRLLRYIDIIGWVMLAAIILVVVLVKVI